jgi:hypothetical protein
MNQLKLSFVLAGTLLGAAVSGLGGCSDDDGADVLPKDPTAQAGSGGGNGTGGSGAAGGGGTAGAGAAGASGSGSDPDASVPRPACPPAPPPVDAGTEDAGGGDAGSTDAGEPDAGRALSFVTDIHPIFRAHCRPCHEDEFSGGHNVAADDPIEAYGFLVGMAASLVPRVNGGNMPPTCDGVPGDPGCISVAELQLIQSWEAQCYPL